MDGVLPFLSEAGGFTSSNRSQKKKKAKWFIVAPLHLVILTLAWYVGQPFQRCADELGVHLKKCSEEAEHFMLEHPLEFDSLNRFQESRARWHHDFDLLLKEVAHDYKSLIAEDDYSGYCTARYPILIFAGDCVALFVLVLVAGYFLFQDATTPFGASRQEILVVTNGMFALLTFLAVFSYPSLDLMSIGVRLSSRLEECTKDLKAAQRFVVTRGLDLDQYNLHAHVWDGMVFGVREPVFNYVIDRNFEEWMLFRFYTLCLFVAGVVTFLVYRANVKSLLRWRSAIPSVVCIGVTFPSSQDPLKLWRVGSGCIVSSSRGLVLTNWHLFQRMGSDPLLSRDSSDPSRPDLNRMDSDVWSVDSNTNRKFNDSPLFGSFSSPWKPATTSDDEAFMLKDSVVSNMVHESRIESMKKSLQSVRIGGVEEDVDELIPSSVGKDFDDDLDGFPTVDEYGVPLTHSPVHSTSAPAILFHPKPEPPATSAHNSKIHRHLTNHARYAESLSDLFPDMKIYIGTGRRAHPKWEYEASFTNVESPSTEFTPFGLDLLLLKITGKVNFTNLQTEEANSADHHSFTYKFDSVTSEPIEKMDEEGLRRFQLGNPFKLSAGSDKLRLLGYPASGGFTLSVLTGYFTSMSFDYPTKQRGAWLNVNIALPYGGSGGAAINSKGELVGICTQTKGDLTNIRSISEARHLIEKAKKLADAEKKKKNDEANAGRSSNGSVSGMEGVKKKLFASKLGECVISRQIG